jgi:tetratricopeptide (TPR) repeat protein
MKYFLLVISVCIWNIVVSQTTQTPDQIRQKMAKIRQTTNWDDPTAAKKANEEIKKLAGQLTGQPANTNTPKQNSDKKPADFKLKTPVGKESTVNIAERFFNRSYKVLDIVLRNDFDIDFKAAEKENFSLEAVRKLTSTGAAFLTFGKDHNLACVYLASAVKAFPTDTLSVNNFGAYLRGIDSTAISIPVLLYANELFSKSPIILTQLGNSYYELNDFNHAENYYKQALKIDPDFTQAHTSLCDLYIKQRRLQDAIVELFAGVKGIGCSYSQLSNNYNFLQKQAEKSGVETDKEKFWNETRNQLNPPDALASLVPEVNRLEIPSFGECKSVADWIEGDGYKQAAIGYNQFQMAFINFTNELLANQKDLPKLQQNQMLRDYPNERFALGCITEYFSRKSNKEANHYSKVMDGIMYIAGQAQVVYLGKKQNYSNEYKSCLEKCVGKSEYCFKECLRRYCAQECPAANAYNNILQNSYDDYVSEFIKTVKNQKKYLDDLYASSGQWFARIESPYWSKIYAYEIQRVALSIIGNTYAAYQQAFPIPAHNECDTDCSLYANPYPVPPPDISKKTPKANECPGNRKLTFSLDKCDLSLDCESIEFGCALGIAASIKRNFIKKTTTGFLGLGVKGGAGPLSSSAVAGVMVTGNDKGELDDVGAKFEVSVSGGYQVLKGGASTSGSFTVMTGLKANADVTLEAGD